MKYTGFEHEIETINLTVIFEDGKLTLSTKEGLDLTQAVKLTQALEAYGNHLAKKSGELKLVEDETTPDNYEEEERKAIQEESEAFEGKQEETSSPDLPRYVTNASSLRPLVVYCIDELGLDEKASVIAQQINSMRDQVKFLSCISEDNLEKRITNVLAAI